MKRKQITKPRVKRVKGRTVRRNGGMDEAQALYETFHQKPSEHTIYLSERVHERGELAGLGTLVELKIVSLTGYEVTLSFEDDPPLLTASPDGTQLYITGGDQCIDLAELEMESDEWLKDRMMLGILTKVTYETEKGFDEFELADYFHHVGEVSGVQPILEYDTLNESLSIVGGRYQIRFEGIVD